MIPWCIVWYREGRVKLGEYNVMLTLKQVQGLQPLAHLDEHLVVVVNRP